LRDDTQQIQNGNSERASADGYGDESVYPHNAGAMKDEEVPNGFSRRSGGGFEDEEVGGNAEEFQNDTKRGHDAIVLEILW
jgi:hypothetical protein